MNDGRVTCREGVLRAPNYYVVFLQQFSIGFEVRLVVFGCCDARTFCYRKIVVLWIYYA